MEPSHETPLYQRIYSELLGTDLACPLTRLSENYAMDPSLVDTMDRMTDTLFGHSDVNPHDFVMALASSADLRMYFEQQDPAHWDDPWEALLERLFRPREDLAHSPKVQQAHTLRGSKEFWEPVLNSLREYKSLKKNRLQERTAGLTGLEKALRAWQANQAKNWFYSELDRQKASYALEIGRLIEADRADVAHRSVILSDARAKTSAGGKSATASARAIRPGGRPSGMADGGLGTGGTGSFEHTLMHPDETGELSLIATHHEAPIVDIARYRIVVEEGRLRTARTARGDESYLIDSEGEWMRYVLLDDGFLYGDQEISTEDSNRAGAEKGFTLYRKLRSHGSIIGAVTCAGDMVVASGKIVQISNQSGTYQPNGANFAAMALWATRNGVLDEQASYQQFIAAPDGGYDVDAGQLKQLRSRAVDAALNSAKRPSDH
ncbi:hypothetical protein ACIQWN_37105 [Streptomyces vinaceus]|uniref:hypothetical protein n=1 Tax=Streptomyces vinaceus TaxID=1960 RepID=UPI00382500A9